MLPTSSDRRSPGEKFDEEAAGLSRSPVPHPNDTAYDSLRAIAACSSGLFTGPEKLEVFTNAHIDRLVRGKAQQSTTPDPESGYKGLGWTAEAASDLVEMLVGGIIERSAGGTLGDTYPDGNPPLDHEDGMVFGACRALASDDPLCRVYCVTRDRGFIDSWTRGRLPGHSTVLSPERFLRLIRAARMRYAMPPPRRDHK